MPNNANSSTFMKHVEPGNITGDYHIIFSNFPFNSTWQEIKDWVSASCPVDFVEVFPMSSSGWIRLKGKDNFMTALAHMEEEPFKDRHLIVDGRNETQSAEIRVKETNRSSSFTEGNRGRRTRSRQNQSPHQATPRHRRTDSVARSETGAIDLADSMARLGNADFPALANFMFGMSLQSTPQMQYITVPLAFPFYNGDTYSSIGNFNNFPYYYGGYNEEESTFSDEDSESSHLG